MGPSGSRDLERLRLQHCCMAQRPGPWLAGLARVKALQAAGPEGGRPGRVGACVGPAGWSGPRRAVVVPPGPSVCVRLASPCWPRASGCVLGCLPRITFSHAIAPLSLEGRPGQNSKPTTAPYSLCDPSRGVPESAMTVRGRRSRDCWDYAARQRPPFSRDSEEIKHQQHCF